MALTTLQNPNQKKSSYNIVVRNMALVSFRAISTHFIFYVLYHYGTTIFQNLLIKHFIVKTLFAKQTFQAL